MSQQINSRLSHLLYGLECGIDGIWSGNLPQSKQIDEQKLRTKIALECQSNFLEEISKHHSITVMDHEVSRYLDSMPKDGIILDVGGCWGWHWRNLSSQRPDICVIIVDFSRANLINAKNLLGTLVGSQVELVHADATLLPFPEGVFDGFWTVQVLQHIPNFYDACSEAYRVMKFGAKLSNHSLHITPLIRYAHIILRKKYHIDGYVKDKFFLCRANEEQVKTLTKIFQAEVVSRYSELLFHPEFRIRSSGFIGTLIGKFDVWLSYSRVLGSFLARQRSFEVIKGEK